jgi:hypothetical protein
MGGKNFRDRGELKVTSQRKALAATICAVLIGGLLLAVPLASAAPPTATVDPASEVELTTAKVSGGINAGGKETNYHFDYLTDAAFNAVTDATQDVAIYAGGGSYTLTFKGQTTPTLPFNASNSTIESALNALSSIGGVGASVSVGPPLSCCASYGVTFHGTLGGQELPDLLQVATNDGFGFEVFTSRTGHTPGFGGAAQVGFSTVPPGTSSEPVPPIQLEGLTAGTTYHLRFVVENEDSAGTPTIVVAPNFTTDPPTAPTMTLDPAGSVSYITAHLSGTLDPNGGSANTGGSPLPIHWDFQVSPNPAEGWTTVGSGDVEESLLGSSDPIPVQADASGLKGGTKYFFRLLATYGNGVVTPSAEPYPEFTTLFVEPPKVISIDNASNVSASGAHLSGEVERPANLDPAFDTACQFEFVTEAQFLANGYKEARAWGCEPAPSAPGKTKVSADLGVLYYTYNSLDFNTTYHQRLTVFNAGGKESIEGATFKTLPQPPPPTISMDEPTEVTGRSAHFTGHVNDGGTDFAQETYWRFECTPECPSATATPLKGRVNPPDGLDHTVQVNVRLKPNTAYEVKMVATTLVEGVESVAKRNFSTPALIAAKTGSANVTGTSASIYGLVDPGGLETTYHFEYGTTNAYGQSTPPNSTPATDQTVGALANITGLTPGITYHYRLVASNAFGSATGADKTFTTVAKPGGESCPNEAVRIQQKSTHLPECRAYEIVNDPSDTNGDMVRVPGSSLDGNAAAYVTTAAGGDVSSNVLISTGVGFRTPTGWEFGDANPTPLSPNQGLNLSFPLAFSTDFKQVLSQTPLQGDPADNADSGDMYRLDVGPAGRPSTWISRPVPNQPAVFGSSFVGASADLSRVVYSQDFGCSGGGAEIWNTTNGVDRWPVGVRPDGTVERAQAAGGPTSVSADGTRVFFNFGDFCHQDGTLAVRDVVAETTTYISRSQRTGDVGTLYPGNFLAASSDGEIVFFKSTERLTDSATVNGGIYRYNLATNGLVQVTPEVDWFEGIQPEAFLKPEKNDTRIYYLTRHALVPGAEEGAWNVYVTDGETTRLVVTVPIAQSMQLSRVSRNGRFILMQSTASISGAPNNKRNAIYEYDYATEDIACASCRANGTKSLGNANLSSVTFGWPNCCVNPRNIADDGQVFFITADRLIAADETFSTDVYMYYKGRLSLISPGVGERDSYMGDNSADGSNIFFLTRSAMAPQDVDSEELDLYDARIDGGFLVPPPAAAPCQGEACRGAASKPPPPSAPTTPSFIGADNSQSGRNQGRKRHKKPHQKKKKKHAKKHRGRGR